MAGLHAGQSKLGIINPNRLLNMSKSISAFSPEGVTSPQNSKVPFPLLRVELFFVLCWRYQLHRRLPSLQHNETRQNFTCGAQRAKKHIIKEAVKCCFLPEHVTGFSNNPPACGEQQRQQGPETGWSWWVDCPFTSRVKPEIKEVHLMAPS